MLYAGVDLHRSFSYITTMNDRGEIAGQKRLPSDGEAVEFLKEFDEDMEVAIESTPSWYWLQDSLESESFDVKLAYSLKTKAIAYARVKTDKVDSITLAHLLRSNLLPLSYVPEKPVRLNKELLCYWAIYEVLNKIRQMGTFPAEQLVPGYSDPAIQVAREAPWHPDTTDIAASSLWTEDEFHSGLRHDLENSKQYAIIMS